MGLIFRPISARGPEEILKSRGRSRSLPSVAAPGALGSRGPRPCRRPPGLGGAGRSRGPAGAGGEGRPERVGDTRGAGGEARRLHPALGRNRPGVVWAPGASGEETRAATDQHQHPAASQLLCALAALRATALPAAPAPRPSSSPRQTSARRAALAAAGTALLVARSVPATHLRARPGSRFGAFPLNPSAFSEPARPRLCLGAERLSECPPT